MAKMAILGYGTVGSGVYEIFSSHSFSEKAGDEISVKRILDIRDFPEHPEKELFTKEFDDILNDGEISVAAETMGGLHPAYEFTKALLSAGKSVVTSNKELVATYGPELMQIAEDNGARYLFEASVGGGIPVIRPLSSCILANDVERIAGILNGTTNFILSEMINKNRDFDEALKDAQNKGYAERNPAADIEGHDASRKIAILASMAWGAFIDYNDVETKGICDVSLTDVLYAGKMNAAIKLIGYAKKASDDGIYACVAPMIVKNSIPLSGVSDVFNAIMVKGDSLGDAMFYGRGAGKLATASAVCADVIDIVKNAGNNMRYIKWQENKINVLPAEDNEWSYFVRCNKTAEEIKNIFADAEFITGVKDGEIGFVTEKMTEKEFLLKLNETGGSFIRILEE